jgi:sensor histidine kinase regulating citrate/malate metabolism
MESRLWKLLWDYDPNGLVVLDANLKITHTNAAFCEMFKADPLVLLARPASELLGDLSDFEKAFRDQTEAPRSEQAYPQFDLYVRKVIFPVPGESVVAGIFVDMTSEWKQNEAMKQLRERVAQEVRQVVDKQMSVAQEIAGLLGETTAETKVGLLRLLETIRREHD